jgi:SAM-dependent methyltransferase
VDEPVSSEILRYYAEGREADRLATGHNQLERAARAGPYRGAARAAPAGAPAVVLDVGGGPGHYALWLARRGYAVHLVDAVPLHVEQARRASAAQPAHPLASVQLGDARRLEVPDGAADAVLLLGPLYHLTARADRLAALGEAHRALRPGGRLFAAAISRFASLLDGLVRGNLADPEFRAMVLRALADGQHRNPTPRDYFTTAYFHRPEELVAEVEESGFTVTEAVGVEGPGWCLADFATRWADAARQAELVQAARLVEREPSLLGLSPHVLAVGCRP